MFKATVQARSGLTTAVLPFLLGSVPVFGDIRMDGAQTVVALEELQDRITNIRNEAQAINDEAAAEDRDLTDDELESIESLTTEAEKLNRQLTARQRLSAINTPGASRRSQPEPTNRTDRPATGATRGTTISATARDPRAGFQTFGEFAMLVARATRNPQTADPRLTNAATTYGNEASGADGGFAVPPQFRQEIWEKVMVEENLLTRCDILETSANSMTVPKDETTPWQTTGGIQVYWEGEGAPAQASKPALEMSTMRLNKLMALVPVSEELMEDASGIESWLRSKAPAKMVAKINTAIISGTGVGQPLGILNSGCTISVAKELSQAADSLYGANIVKMWGRMYAPCRRNAVWLINQDAEPALDLMGFAPLGASKATIDAATTPLYIPAGGLSSSPYASLKGRPVIPVEACKTLGDQGDIILADLTQYMALTKAGQGIRTDVSMHLYFDQALQAFRFIFRVNGQPWWGSAIAPQNGNLTRSCFVTLDERS